MDSDSSTLEFQFTMNLHGPHMRGYIINIFALYHFSRDLIAEDGVTFEIGEEYLENDDEDFSYSPFVQFSNEEMLNMLNMNGFEDDDDRDDEKGTVSLCGMSFAKLKTKMTSITSDQKVNQILYYKFFFLFHIIKMM